MSIDHTDIRRAGSIDGVIDAAEELVADLAADDAPSDFCGMCVDDTPLAYNWASDIGPIKRVRAVVSDARERVEQLEGDGPHYWVKNHLERHYIEAYRGACADPDDCEVCQNPEGYDRCGHIRHNQVCPARA